MFWNLIRLACRRIMLKHRPRVVAISGSVGKSSTKSAIAHVLGHHFSVRETHKNFNTEIGVALCLLNVTDGSGLMGRIRTVVALIRTYFARTYPQVLVLELAVDHPGDMDYFRTFFPYGLEIAVLTSIEPIHLINFTDIEQIAQEKAKIFSMLASDGLAILNADCEQVSRCYSSISGASVCFGTCATEGCTSTSDEKAHTAPHPTHAAGACSKHVCVRDVTVTPQGTSFDYTYHPDKTSGHITTQALGSFVPTIVLPSVIVGRHFGLSLDMISDALSDFSPPSGRLSFVSADRECTILDGTYNASPPSMRGSILTHEELMKSDALASHSRVLILGDMLELGDTQCNSHIDILRFARTRCDVLVLIGPLFVVAQCTLEQEIAQESQEATCKTFTFESVIIAIDTLRDIVPPQSLVLIKGSNGTRTHLALEQLL